MKLNQLCLFVGILIYKSVLIKYALSLSGVTRVRVSEEALNDAKVYLALLKRHKRRERKRMLNVKQGLIAPDVRKGSLHSDLNIAIRIIQKLLENE